MGKASAAYCLAVSLVVLATLSLLSPSPVDAQQKILGEEHWVQSVSAADGKPLKIYLWEKRLNDLDVKQFATAGRVVLLAHGATISGRVDFDPQIPEAGLTYSLMDYLAERGFDVFSLDYQNYGRSDHHECGLCVTTQVAARDLHAAVDYIRTLRGVDRVHLLGWSWGATTTGLFTMHHPHKVKRLVLFAPPVWHALREKPPTTEFRTGTEEGYRKLFEPNATEPGVAEAFAKEAMRWDPRSPNGVLMDLRARMPILDPRQITVPVLIILGELDSLTPTSQSELPGFFADLANPDKQFTIVPGAGHALHLRKPRLRFFVEVTKWFTIDQPGWRMEVIRGPKP
ncbi:MAG: alpha/beta fold hydrolase [candidate division NC10 bacterium]|nr:alpha/beta fold hydrolase [candidate division NC10 bacterium]